MKTERPAYEDLIAWQKSMEFANQVLDLTEKVIQTHKQYRLADQLAAAATSISANIARVKGAPQRKILLVLLSSRAAHCMKR